MESNRSTMSFIDTLINVGLRFQPCHSPTKGVNVAVSLLFTFMAETTLSYMLFSRNIFFGENPYFISL